ncbi:Fc.00g056710.m01.CDS01 [Cosmosporella sp. VM-42]
MIKLYTFLLIYAYREFDLQAWDFNTAIIGLLESKRQQGLQLRDCELFLEKEAFISAADIAPQTRNHYPEGLAYLQRVDLSVIAEPMREHLEVRKRDITAELMGYALGAESYHG